jgi:hypothetical protein
VPSKVRNDSYEKYGGRLANFIDNWKNITSDPYIHDIVENCHIEFDMQPPPENMAKQLKFSKSEKQKMDLEIKNLLNNGVIENSEMETEQFVGHVFCRNKKDGSVRIILNLKPLNQFVTYKKFKMDTRQMAARLITPGAYMASVDLKQAYYLVSVAQEHRKYLKFWWDGNLYQYVGLPNGLACAPRLFTKLLKPVYSTLQKEGFSCLGYIDDSFFVASSEAECQRAVDRAIKLFNDLGFLINWEKSVLTPTQSITFLGFQFSSTKMKITLGQDKIKNLVEHCQKIIRVAEPTIREVATLIGIFVAYSDGTKSGMLYFRHLEEDKKWALRCNRGNYDSKMKISSKGRKEINWWLENVHHQAKDIHIQSPQIEITSDASKSGWGGAMNGTTTRGKWTAEEKKLDINVLELKAAFLTLQSLAKHLSGVHIQIRSDNTTAVAYINNMGGSVSKKCNAESKALWEWALSKDIWISACHIPGVQNVTADVQSRLLEEEKEWKLNKVTFNKICKKFGSPTIDLFASRIAHQLENYVSWKPDPQAVHIDAFSMKWNSFFYAFPPFSVVDRCIQKIQMEGGEGILVVPRWTTRPWWAQLQKMTVNKQPVPKAAKKLHNPATNKTHPLKHLDLVACHILVNR